MLALSSGYGNKHSLSALRTGASVTMSDDAKAAATRVTGANTAGGITSVIESLL